MSLDEDGWAFPTSSVILNYKGNQCGCPLADANKHIHNEYKYVLI